MNQREQKKFAQELASRIAAEINALQLTEYQTVYLVEWEARLKMGDTIRIIGGTGFQIVEGKSIR